MAEEWVKNSHEETRAAHNAREIAEAHLNALKDQQKQMAEQVKKALQDKANAEAGLKTTEKRLRPFVASYTSAKSIWKQKSSW